MTVVEATLAEHAPLIPVARVAHLDPPTSPSKILFDPLGRLLVVATLFVSLAIAAFVNGGSLLLHVDRPISQFLIDHRTPWLDRVFLQISFFGSTRVVLAGGVLLAIIAWPKCRMASALMIGAMLTRPLLEFNLKNLVGRDRPNLSRMVNGVGYSFPSGHVMAAAALWLMVPVVVSLYTSSRRVWMCSVVFSLTAVVLIAASRVYLGVHWTSDVLAGGLAAAMLLALLDVAFRRLHAPRGCAGGQLTGC